jgi:hypothetical protein
MRQGLRQIVKPLRCYSWHHTREAVAQLLGYTSGKVAVFPNGMYTTVALLGLADLATMGNVQLSGGIPTSSMNVMAKTASASVGSKPTRPWIDRERMQQLLQLICLGVKTERTR